MEQRNTASKCPQENPYGKMYNDAQDFLERDSPIEMQNCMKHTFSFTNYHSFTTGVNMYSDEHFYSEMEMEGPIDSILNANIAPEVSSTSKLITPLMSSFSQDESLNENQKIDGNKKYSFAQQSVSFLNLNLLPEKLSLENIENNEKHFDSNVQIREESFRQPSKDKRLDKKGEKKKKNDERKNVYGNAFKNAIKTFLSPQYNKLFRKYCKKYKVSQEEVESFYSPMTQWQISLKDVRYYLDFASHPPESSQRRIKQCFQRFHQWYLKDRYAIHILTSDKCLNKQIYLETKNKLIYLPDIKIQLNESN